MNKAKKAYSSKSAAKRAFLRKVNTVHESGTSGEITFGRIYFQDNFLYAESSFWEADTLEDFLNSKKELVQ